MAIGTLGHLRSLTEVRFFAAFAVLMYHGTAAFGATETWYGSLSEVSFAGVSFFFVLSGFVLTWSRGVGTSAAQFYFRRFARIWPLYALMWVAAIAAILISSGNLDITAALLGTFLLQAWSPKFAQQINVPAWSLSVEAFFYLMFPAVILAVRQLNRSAALIGIVCGWAWIVLGDLIIRQFLDEPRLGQVLLELPLFRIGEFVSGMCLAQAMLMGWRTRVPLWAPLLALAVVIVVRPTGWLGDLAVGDMLLIGLLPVWLLLIAGMTGQDLAQPAQLPRCLTELGNSSYALYISHVVVLIAWAGLGLPQGSPAVLPVYVIVCVAASLVLHRGFELPVERRLRTFAACRAATRST